MKLKTIFSLKSREGEEKIVRKFLLFPLYFDEEKVSRWLEVADVVYKIKKLNIGDHFSVYTWKWQKERYATDEDYRRLSFERQFDGMSIFLKGRSFIEGIQIFWMFIDCLFVAIILFNFEDFAKDSRSAIIPLFLVIKLIQCIVLALSRSRHDEV